MMPPIYVETELDTSKDTAMGTACAEYGLGKADGFALNRSARVPARDQINISVAGVSAPIASVPIPAGSAASLIDQDSDTLIFQGIRKEIATLEQLLSQIDVAAGEVVIKAVVYEVTTGRSEGTAFSLAATLLSGKLGCWT